MSERRFKAIVVGGGLAGLMTTIKLCEAGVKVSLFSLVSVKRSHSVCAQGGINASINIKGEGDSPAIHFDETIYGGDFLANQPPVKGMCYEAPKIIALLDRMGVPFNRTPEGNLDFRRFGGTLFHRTVFAGATTGQQMLYALDEQVRRYEAMGLVTKYEYWDFLGIVMNEEGRCIGIVAQDLKSMNIEAFRADSVCLATGGVSLIFGRTTNSVINTGAATAAVYQQGAIYANPEFIQLHPTAIPGTDKLRLMSESARGEGGRIWVPKDPYDKRDPREIPEKDRYYFLEERYPGYGNLVPRDIASREIFKVCIHEGRGIGGKPMVYLDVTHLPREVLDRKLGGILEIYEKFVGEDPRKVPMKVFPAVHYSMGGLWVDYEKGSDGFIKVPSPRNQQTNIPGLFAAGEADYQYHGANRLGANSLLSCLYAGIIGGPAMVSYMESLEKLSEDQSSIYYEQEKKRREEEFEEILKMDGKENPYQLHKELGEMMLAHVTVERYNNKLKEVDDKIGELMERYRNIGLPDKSRWANQSAQFTRHLKGMLILARVITRAALLRDESRGAHYKPEFPERNDEKYLKTTIARFNPQKDGPDISYEDVDTSIIKPRKRSYKKKGESFESAEKGEIL